jgi:hypothetical protein
LVNGVIDTADQKIGGFKFEYLFYSNILLSPQAFRSNKITTNISFGTATAVDMNIVHQNEKLGKKKGCFNHKSWSRRIQFYRLPVCKKALTLISRAQIELFDKKNQRSKISWHCPSKGLSHSVHRFLLRRQFGVFW